jgi:hypothetical protein
VAERTKLTTIAIVVIRVASSSSRSLQASLSVDVESFLFGFGFWDTCTCAVWLLASGHIVPVFVHHAHFVNSYCPGFGLLVGLVVDIALSIQYLYAC